MTEHAALVALLNARPGGLRWTEITAEVIETGSALEVWQRHTPLALIEAPGESNSLEGASATLAQWADEDWTFLTILDEEYPSRLRDIHQAPPMLFACGSLRQGEPAVAVVGSRQATAQGLAFAGGIAKALVAEGITVLSGLAAGIDAAAHTAALETGGRTVAVIGTGIDRAYPAENRELQAEISRRGLVLSQFWPGSPPRKQNFIMRNATMSGYGMATVVVEAGETSGARAQARIAVEHGRPVVLMRSVVEANEWAKRLVERPRVHVVDSVSDVIDVVRQLSDEDASLEHTVQALVSIRQ